MVGFLIFKTLCLGNSKTLSYVWRKYHKNERYLCLLGHIFTKLSHNVCLIYRHILIYWYGRCDCKLWKVYWFYCVFWIFSYIIDNHSCLYCCISTKLPQIMCLIDVHILVFQYTKCDCRLLELLWFNLKSYNFIKLLEIVC